MSMFWKDCLPASSKKRRRKMLRNFDLGFTEFRFITAALLSFLNSEVI